MRLSKLAAVKIADFEEVNGQLSLRLGPEPLELPANVAEVAREAIAHRDVKRLFGTAKDYVWLLPGEITGQHTSIEALSARLQKVGVSTREAKRSALAPLAMSVPAIILSRLTGIHPNTANNWSNAVASSNARYAAERMHLSHPLRTGSSAASQ